MKTRTQKWGNGLALRIPKILADKAGLEKGSSVELSFEHGEIVITPLHTYDLDGLLEQVSEENKHSEIDIGSAQGKETW